MTQSLIFCANRLKTSADVQEMIKSDVRPQYASLGCTSVENHLSKQFGEDGNIFFQIHHRKKYCQIHQCTFHSVKI